jgi:hypothetical protein
LDFQEFNPWKPLFQRKNIYTNQDGQHKQSKESKKNIYTNQKGQHKQSKESKKTITS